MFSLSHSIRRVANNLAANALGQVMNGIYQIVSIPLFLHYWSKAEYGEWLVIFSIPSLLWSLEGGLAAIASNRMTVAGAAGNWSMVNEIFHNVLLAQGVLCLAVISGTLALISTCDLQAWFNFTHISPGEVSTVLLLLIWYMVSGFYISLLRAAYRAAVCEARGIMVNSVWRLIDFCLIVVGLVSGGDPLVLAQLLLGGALICVAGTYLDVRRHCPLIEFGVSRATRDHAKQIFIDGFPMLVGQAAGAFVLQGYPIIINQALGASAVVTFATVRTVSRTILLFIQVIGYSSSPEVARSYGRQDWEVYLRLLKIMLASAIIGGLVTLVGLTIGGPLVILLWTGGSVVVSHFTMLLFSASIALQGIWGIGGIVLSCSNRHHLFNYLYMTVTLVTLGLAALLLPYWGFAGVPATMVIQDLALVIIVAMLCKSKLTHLTLSDLRPVLTYGFYRAKVVEGFERVWKRIGRA